MPFLKKERGTGMQPVSRVSSWQHHSIQARVLQALTLDKEALKGAGDGGARWPMASYQVRHALTDSEYGVSTEFFEAYRSLDKPIKGSL